VLVSLLELHQVGRWITSLFVSVYLGPGSLKIILTKSTYSLSLKGIGKATAFAFAQHGAKALAIGDLNSKATRDTAAELKQAYPNVEVLPLELDVSKEQSIDDAVAQVASKLGRIDYAVNNAGIGGQPNKSAELQTADWKRVIDVNLNGVWMSSRAEIRQMLKQELLEPG
jgi:NAD(P)-dependent dehydrogenase (short-subunit alcohol dehydrogenase family)